MKSALNFYEAVDLLEAYSVSKSSTMELERERLAVITHWLTVSDVIPPYASKEMTDEWFHFLQAINLTRTKTREQRLAHKHKLTRKIIDLENSVNFPPPKKPKFDFIDLFAGIGGFRLGLQSNGGRCVFSSEWNPHAKATYFKNFGEYPYGDLTQYTNPKISDEELKELIPDHDVLAAGFPCQPFSRAGVSARTSKGVDHGFECSDQGTLFFDIIRIAKQKKPKVLFLENTSNIVNHENGETFSIIKDTIESELGYSFAYKIIDSSPIVPQKRKRCYIICLRDPEITFKFRENWFDGSPKPVKEILEQNPDPSYTISDKLWDGHINRSARNKSRGTGFVITVADLDSPTNTLVARYGKDGKECLIKQEKANPRKLTIRECARLQGFPEDFEPASSRTQAYIQFGNTVVVPIIQILGREIKKYLKKL